MEISENQCSFVFEHSSIFWKSAYLILHFGSACRNCPMPSRLTLV